MNVTLGEPLLQLVKISQRKMCFIESVFGVETNTDVFLKCDGFVNILYLYLSMLDVLLEYALSTSLRFHVFLRVYWL